jgi:hypothetical protein
MIKKPGAINGGFFPKKPDWPDQYPSIVIAVDDIKKAMKKNYRLFSITLFTTNRRIGCQTTRNSPNGLSK